MTFDDFVQSLRETGGYRTEAPKVALPSALATPLFGLRMLGAYLSAYRRAKRPTYPVREFAEDSFGIFRSVEAMGGCVEIEGFQHAAEVGAEGAVVTSNHVSSLETWLLPGILSCFRRTSFVVKDSLVHYPLFGPILRAIDPICVTRRNALDDLRVVLKEGERQLRDGRFVVLFPEGTRSRLFRPAAFNSIGTKLARRASVPVLPVCVATDFIRIGEWNHDLFATCRPTSIVRIACGEPIPPTLSAVDLQARQVAFVEQTLSRWQALDRRPLLLS